MCSDKKKRAKDMEEEDATAGLDDPTPEPNITEVPLPKPGTIGMKRVVVINVMQY